MFSIWLAPGFEEIEALAVVDILRRAELPVMTVGVGGRLITGSHGIPVMADIEAEGFAPVDDGQTPGMVLPGGMPGTLNLDRSPVVDRWIRRAAADNWWLCAICAAPSILGHRGLLQNRRATCFPGFEQELTGAHIQIDPVVVDGNIITAKGAGAAVDFALRIVGETVSSFRATALRDSLQCP